MDITGILETLARDQPKAAALHVPGRTSLSYADLGAQIRYVRERLGGWGVARGDIVAGVIPARPEMALACATIPSGAAFAPISPSLTFESYVDLLTRMRPKLVITPDDGHPMSAAARQCGVAEASVSGDPSRPAGMFALDQVRGDASLDRGASTSPECAFVITTSGTTGRPKLVPISHRRSSCFATSAGEWVELSPSDVGCHVQQMYHGHGLNSGLITPLLRGSSVVCLPESDVDGFFAALGDYHVTWLTAVFTIYRALLRRAPDFHDAVAGNRLRFLKVGSGRLEPHEIDAIERTFRAPVLMALIAQEVFLVSHDPLPPRPRKRGLVGVPVTNEVGILGEDGTFCPTGDTGEIVVRGPMVFDGYLDDAEATAAAFIGGWCRTGDLGHFDGDGYLELTGRVKDLISRGGEKISPVRIDAVVESHPGVRAAGTFGVPHPTLGEEVITAVVNESGAQVLESEIIDHARRELGPTWAPRRIFFLDELPRTDSGKIRRVELARLYAQARQNEAAARLPAPETAEPHLSPLEGALAGLWSAVLGVPGIGRGDDFFLLGGDSLRGAQLLAHVQELLGVELSVGLLFGPAATVAGMARAIEEARTGSGDAERGTTTAAMNGGIPRRLDEGPAVLSHMQLRLWFLAQLHPDSSAYNEADAHRITGPLDVAALRESLLAVVQRHEMLRTTFAIIDGEPRQLVRAAAHLDFESLTLPPRSTVDEDAALRAIINAEIEKPFDLQTGPLARFRLIRISETDHVLLRVWHHIVSDASSVGVLHRELTAGYAALTQGRDPARRALPIQYADYAVWQRDRLEGAVLEEQLAYWRHTLAGVSPLALPTDQPRAAMASRTGAHLVVDLPASLIGALKALSRREGATLFMTLLAAFKVLLARHSGQEDIAVGTPVAGRGRTELRELIGFFVKTLVLRTDLSGNPSFRELLARVRETALGAYANQDVPFEKLVETLAPARDLSRNPLFDVMLNYVDNPEPPLDLPGLIVQPMGVPSAAAKFDFNVFVRVHERGASLRLVYQRELFSPARIAVMLEQYVALLEQSAAAPERRIHDYSLVTTRPGAGLPDPTLPIEAPAQQPVVEQVLAWVHSAPDRTAVRGSSRQWTYADLGARAESLAATLQAMDVERGDVVAIVGPRSVGLVGAMLGVLMSGGVLLTIDSSLPLRRKRIMLVEARAKVVCLIGQPDDDELEREPSGYAILRTDLDLAGHSGREAGAHRAWLPPAIHGDDPAYVFFTSGSTGQPKAILGCHKGLSHFLQWQRSAFAIGEDDRVSQLTGLTFDALLRDVFLPLTSGAAVCVPAESDRLDTLGWIQREAVAVVHTTPTVLQAWLHDGERRLDLPSLRWLFVSGEPFTDALIGRWRQVVSSPAQLVNLYGPSETTMIRCFHVIPADVAPGVQPIGVPLPDSQALILNASGTLCGIGETGEIALRTPFRTLGYLNLPDENTRRFRPNPFRDDPDDLVYFTGDLGRYRTDGLLEIGGRIDDQVKVRGVRIEPGEVAAVLARHDAVRNCLVVGHQDTDGQQRLASYVVLHPGRRVDTRELRAHLAAHLPPAYVPEAFVFMDALPVLPNGKVNRRALPAPTFGAEAGEPFVAPRDALEEAIADVWREVLHVKQVGAHDNFFELGGHSLLAVQAVSRIRRRFDLDVSVGAIFEHPTLAALALALLRQRAEANGGATHIPRRAADTPPPLSFGQQRLWFLSQLDGQSIAYHACLEAAYNMPSAWQLQGPLDVEALARSLEAVLARHETLRTRIALHDGVPAQMIDPPAAVALPVTDLGALAPAAREARARMLAEAEARQPFDLAAGPLLRAQLLRLDTEEHWLLLTLHHIASDGWSMGVLHRELAAAYAAIVRGTAPAFAALPIQYADYAVWQREWLRGAVLEEQLAYWRHTLAGVSPLALPTDRPRPAMVSHRGAQLTVDLPRPLIEALTRLGQHEGTTLFMTLLAAFQVLLARYSGQDDIAVGTPIAGRQYPEVEGLIGFFVNTLVLRTDLSGNPRFRDVLARVRERALGAYTHQDLPFEKLVEALAPVRDLSREPLFQMMFVLQNTPGTPLALEGLEASRLPLSTYSAKFDLTLSVRESANLWHARWEYAKALFDASTVERLARHFQVLLEAIVTDPEQRIGEIPLLTAAERHQLLVTGNGTAAEFPRNRGVHHLFEEQVTRTPEAVAVACGDEHLTYAELNGRANCLAHHLISLGVGPEVLVGVCLERSSDLVVALLGLLKAGGAYLPFDPSWPTERLRFMLADARPAVLLTQQGLQARLPPFEGHLLCLDRDWPAVAAERDTNPPARVKSSETLAYVIYTSGSTGTPKGVLLPHATLLNLLAWQGRGASSGRVAQFTSMSFDVSLQEILYALLSGRTLVVVNDDTRLEPERFAAFLEDNAITDLFVPNVVLQYVAQAVVQNRRSLPVLANVYQAGEALTITPGVQAFFERHPGCRLHNHYGPAESHVVTSEILPADVSAWPARPAIGSPIANTRIRILDKYGEPVPIGVPGEIYIGGAGLARGYLNRPELTTTKFVMDSFSPGARLYRTGDLARYLPDGRIEFLGRLDDQVKIRGFRIEPGEIQSVLAEHPGVRQAVVVAQEGTPGERRLVAYLVPADASWADTEAVRAFVRARLPDYMRPAAYVFLERLPLTPTGKVDRQALPAPDPEALVSRGYEPPVGEIETVLAQVWAEVLKLGHVGRHDDFFELGGHSLLAVQVASRIRGHFDVEVPVRVIFEQPTLDALAAWLLERHTAVDGDGEIERILRELEALPDEAAVDDGSQTER